MEKLIDISSYPVLNVLHILLQDKSTKKNIIWATDTYEDLGEGFTDKVQINKDSLFRRTDIIRPRIQKSQEAQAQRTRKKAEVFTPVWVCNKMNNHCDEDWFGRENVFNTENDDCTWTVTEGKIEFPKGKKWQQYVDNRRLEITCGEAPYLVSRYDVSTGQLIIPPIKRIGILDRKLRIVNENTDNYDDWLKWTIRAFEASYGYEYQGDNVLIARINLLLSFVDYYEERWERQPDDKLLRQISNIIAKNIWQMDGLKGTVPLGKPYEEYKQLSFFDTSDTDYKQTPEHEAVPCKIYDWRSKVSLKFINLKEMQTMGKKLFDYVIGNPPYQDNTVGEQKTFAPPIYNLFMDAVYSVSDKVELITPARFLFNAGGTPKAWNEKMLSDPHLKVLYHEQNSANIFPNTDIKGGVAITYHDANKNFGAIEIYTAFEELNSILHKVKNHANFSSFSKIIYNRGLYRFSKKIYEEFPMEMKQFSDSRVGSSSFERLPDLFTNEKPNDDNEYIQIYGLSKGSRVYRWFKKDYVKPVDNLDKYKIFVPAANGSGSLGEVLSTPVIGLPVIGHTETFLSIGCFDSKNEAEGCLKYVKSKFARVMLGILKITQHNSAEKWIYVPLQDFTENSDIDWSKSVAEIDKQLYKKYGLTHEEIDFIETHVKEMA